LLKAKKVKSCAPLLVSDPNGPYDLDLRIHIPWLLTHTSEHGVVWDILSDMFHQAGVPRFKVMSGQTIPEKANAYGEVVMPARYDRFAIRMLGVGKDLKLRANEKDDFWLEKDQVP